MVCPCFIDTIIIPADQIEQAVTDMNAGLQLKELLLEPYDRRLAEGLESTHTLSVYLIVSLCSHFNLGLAYSLQKNYQASIKVVTV